MTPTGRAVLVVGVVVFVLGLATGYPAVSALGATLVAAVALAFALVRRPVRLSTSRVVEPDRVTAGEGAHSRLTITNIGRRSTSAGTVRERVGEETLTVDLPALAPGESTTVVRELPTDRRGVFAIGPLTVRRGDPIGLVRRGDDQSDLGELIVHPRIHLVSPFPAGIARDLDGIPSGEASEGGITFSGLREYVPGDDLRLVHWRSSARMGELMVRHNIDVHRPGTTVLLDTNAGVHDDSTFEDAVRVAASIISAAMLRRFPFALRTTCGQIIDERSQRVAVLDAFAALGPVTDGGTIGEIASAAARNPTGFSCAVVTGRAGVDVLRPLGPLRGRFEQLTIVRLGSAQAEQVHKLVGAELINAGTSDDFARAWNRHTRS